MNWERHFHFNLLFIAVVCLASCKKDDGAGCFIPRGDETTQLTFLDPFSKMDIQGRFDIHLIQDSVDYVDITYGEHSISGIEAEVKDGELVVRDNNRCGWTRKVRPLPRLDIHYSSLSKVYSQNSGSIIFDNSFSLDSLKLEVIDVSGNIEINAACDKIDLRVHTAATDIKMEGTCREAYIYNAGYAPIRAENLVCRRASVHNNSTGDTYIRVWETLFTQIYHRGDIHVYGNPEVVEWHNSGGGEIILED